MSRVCNCNCKKGGSESDAAGWGPDRQFVAFREIKTEEKNRADGDNEWQYMYEWVNNSLA